MTWLGIFELVAKFAPVATASIALAAAVIAWRAIRAQRDIARRRAAIDFFLKTEMDKVLIDLYHKFKGIAPTLKSIQSFPEFAKTEEYKDVRGFLNICELIATGINHEAFAEQVSRAYWGNILPDSYKDASPLIEYVRRTPSEGAVNTYIELEIICKRWTDKGRNSGFGHTLQLLSVILAGFSAGLGWWATTLPPLVIGSYWQPTAAAIFALISAVLGIAAFWQVRSA